MKKLIFLLLTVAFFSCTDSGRNKITTREDTANITMDSTDTTVGHPRVNGYPPPNAKGGDSLANKSDSLNQK
jgi:hypothetical protein